MKFQTSNVSISDGNVKYFIHDSEVHVILMFKLFRVTVAGTDIVSLSHLQLLDEWCVYHRLVNFNEIECSKLYKIWSF